MTTDKATKHYASRDSATQVLKKMGVAKGDYDLFITKDKDGAVLDLASAKRHLADADKRALEALAAKNKEKTDEAAAAAAAAPKPERETRPAGERKPSVASVARELILAGLDNAAVFTKLHEQFGLDDGKKHYPAWYRSDLKRKGLLPATPVEPPAPQNELPADKQ